MLRYGSIIAIFGGIPCRFHDQTTLKGYIMAANDMDEARSTYDSFMGTLKWAVPVIAVLTFLVVLLIS